jgi:hypothetical protein
MLHRSISLRRGNFRRRIMVAKAEAAGPRGVPGVHIAPRAALLALAVLFAAVLLPLWAWLAAAAVLALGVAVVFAEARRNGLLDLPRVRRTADE